MSSVANLIGVRQPLAGVVYPPHEDLRRYMEAGLLGGATLPEAFADSFRNNAQRTAICGPEGTLSYLLPGNGESRHAIDEYIAVGGYSSPLNHR